MSVFAKITNPFRSFADAFLARFLMLPMAVVGAGFLFSILRPEVDLAKVCFSSFALLAGLAGASLSLARSIGPEELRDRLAHIGERFLHGAVLLLISGGVAFGFAMLGDTFAEIPKPTLLIPRFAIVVPLLVAAFGYIGDGFSALNWILHARRNRYRFWDNPVPPVTAMGAKEKEALASHSSQPVITRSEAVSLGYPQPDLAPAVVAHSAADEGVAPDVTARVSPSGEPPAKCYAAELVRLADLQDLWHGRRYTQAMS